MNQLHIVSQSPFTTTTFAQAVKVVSADDAIVLINDGVYACYTDISSCSCVIYALDTELQLRAINAPSTITVIDIATFVQLSISAKHCVSWF